MMLAVTAETVDVFIGELLAVRGVVIQPIINPVLDSVGYVPDTFPWE